MFLISHIFICLFSNMLNISLITSSSLFSNDNSNTAEDASINGRPALIDLKNGEKVILVLLPLKKHIVCSGTENTHGNHPIYGYLKDRRTSSVGLSTRKLPPLCAASSAWSMTARACIRSRIFCPRKRCFVRLVLCQDLVQVKMRNFSPF